MKAGEAHTVYLSKSARGILAVIRGMSDRWVFCSPTGDRPMSNMAMLLLLRRLKVNQLTTVHGLCRATFSTWANETNAARREVIEACLAHRESDAVRAAYNRAQFADERRALLAAWGKYVMSATAQTSSQSTKARLSRAKLVAAKLPLARRG